MPMCPHTSIFDCQDQSNLASNTTTVVEYAFDHDDVSKYMRRIEAAFFFISCFLIVLGVVGNVLIVYVIITRKDMRSVCNVFVANLAIRDIVFLLIFALMETIAHGHYVFNDEHLLSQHMSLVSVYALTVTVLVTSGLLVALSRDRYRSIGHPLKSTSKKSLVRALIISIAIWIVSLALCVVHPIFRTPSSVLSWLILVSLMTFIAYILPLVAVCICYARIYLAVRVGQQVTGESDHLTRWEFKRKVRVLRMVAYVIVLFFACWGFWWAYNLFVAYKNYRRQPLSMGNEIALDVADILVFANSALNPFIYGLTNANFKRHFKGMLCWSFAPRSLQHTAATPDSVRLPEPRVGTLRNANSDRKAVRMSMVELEDSTITI